jgi:hypothetical protein
MSSNELGVVAAAVAHAARVQDMRAASETQQHRTGSKGREIVFLGGESRHRVGAVDDKKVKEMTCRGSSNDTEKRYRSATASTNGRGGPF